MSISKGNRRSKALRFMGEAERAAAVARRLAGAEHGMGYLAALDFNRKRGTSSTGQRGKAKGGK